MTKKERTRKPKEILADLLAPKPGNGSLHVKAHAPTAHRLFIDILRDKAPDQQMFVHVQICERNIVRDLHDQLTRKE